MRWRPPTGRWVRQRVALATAATLSVGLITAVVFGSRGLLHLRTLSAEKHEVGRQIALRLHENDRLRERVRQLRTDDRTLERLAREQLGFTRPGEVIYRFGNRPRFGDDAHP
jgi:cell division protein FtsB